MRFRVIEGGKAVETAPVTGPDRIRQEAERRIKASGYEQWRVRSLVTGAPIPSSIEYLKMQIDFVAEKLRQLGTIPHDFADDKYWPTVSI